MEKIKHVKLVIAQTSFREKTVLQGGDIADAFPSREKGYGFLKCFGPLSQGGNRTEKIYFGPNIRNCRVRGLVRKEKKVWENILGSEPDVKLNLYVRVSKHGFYTLSLSCFISSEDGISFEKLILLSRKLHTQQGRNSLRVSLTEKWGKEVSGPSSIEQLFDASIKRLRKSLSAEEDELISTGVYATCVYYIDSYLKDSDAKKIQGIVLGETKYQNLAVERLDKTVFGKYTGDHISASPHKVTAFVVESQPFPKRSPYFVWALFKVQELFQIDLLTTRWLMRFFKENTLIMRRGNHETGALLKQSVKPTYYKVNADRKAMDVVLGSAHELYGGAKRLYSILSQKSHYSQELAFMQELRSEYIDEANAWRPGLAKLKEFMGDILSPPW